MAEDHIVLRFMDKYHRTSDLHSPNGGTRKYAQLYYGNNPQAALSQRRGNPQNKDCEPQLLLSLDAFMRANNVFAKCFRMLS